MNGHEDDQRTWEQNEYTEQEVINKELENIKNTQTVMNNTKTKMKNTLKGINNRLNDIEEWISELEDRVVDVIAAEQKKEKIMKRNEHSSRDLWDNSKHINIHIIWVSEGKKDIKGLRTYFEDIIAENFSNLKENSYPSPGNADSPIQDESKEEHIKIL